MIETLKDLIGHNGYANASLLGVIRQQQAAAQDAGLLKLLHHIHIANRHWFLLIVNESFVVEEESRLPDSLETIAGQFKAICDREILWVSQIAETDLARRLESPFLPGLNVLVAEAMIQVCLHSAAHRAQCAIKLRELGGEPPMIDFILWLKDRPSPNW